MLLQICNFSLIQFFLKKNQSNGKKSKSKKSSLNCKCTLHTQGKMLTHRKTNTNIYINKPCFIMIYLKFLSYEIIENRNNIDD